MRMRGITGLTLRCSYLNYGQCLESEWVRLNLTFYFFRFSCMSARRKDDLKGQNTRGIRLLASVGPAGKSAGGQMTNSYPNQSNQDSFIPHALINILRRSLGVGFCRTSPTIQKGIKKIKFNKLKTKKKKNSNSKRIRRMSQFLYYIDRLCHILT